MVHISELLCALFTSDREMSVNFTFNQAIITLKTATRFANKDVFSPSVYTFNLITHSTGSVSLSGIVNPIPRLYPPTPKIYQLIKTQDNEKNDSIT